MNVPLKWLNDFVDPDVSVKDLAHRLTMAGLEVEKIEEIGNDWDHVYVGKVLGVSPHPDADRLVLADVEAGKHHLTVVTGAPNIAAGQTVALALAGANLIDGHSDSGQKKVLKPTKMRGVMSEGMVCSEKELGLSDEHEGIMVLDDNAPIGLPLQEYLGDSVLEFEITPNLAHNFSMHGVAREVSALYDIPITVPTGADLATLPAGNQNLVVIENTDLCPRYAATVCEGIEVGPSPAWLARRLQNAGVRPINNVVDVTNYVMLETGQPLHAFDRDMLEGGRIVVRTARAGEMIETLDHIERKLDPDRLVIADASKPVGLAGVMGGVSSEVTDTTTEVLLEGANFNMKSVRHTSRALKLRTDASARYERGVDPNLVAEGMARAIALLLLICPNARVTAFADVYPEPLQPTTLTMRTSRFEQVLGISIPMTEIIDVLGRLGFDAETNADSSQLNVTVPTWRKDVSIPDDIVEEVARVVGYDTLPSTLPWGQTAPVKRDPVYQLRRHVRDAAAAAGGFEAVTYVTDSETDVDAFRGRERGSAGLIVDVPVERMLRIINPMQSGRNLLRVSLIPSLLEPLGANLKHTSAARLFECARLYVPNGPDELPAEVEAIGFVIAGERESLSVYGRGGELDFFDIKGMIEHVLQRAGIPDLTFEPAIDPALHPGRTASVSSGGTKLGILGELLPDVASAFGIDDVRVAVAEISLTAVLASLPSGRRDVPVQRYLPVRQDFAIIVDEATPAGDVERTLLDAGRPLASSADLFDIFRGEQIGEGKKSLAYRVTFIAPDRTLTDDDLVKFRKRIEKNLKQQVGGALRV
ncbi:MAG: phenylalanine--tRNA ligase subunit beta [Thermomicrobiales bacterium]|nr:phenylalanine--tRNA ligase subunit beta [Thermomicrobiales bacterium]